jgi:hypothetical protein
MPYPRTFCPACTRDVAVYPVAHRISRHDPPTGRTEDLRSCPGSLTRHAVDPERYGQQDELF